jgi:hypothetical protein
MKSAHIDYAILLYVFGLAKGPYRAISLLNSVRLHIRFHVFVTWTFRDANMYDTLRLKLLLRSCQREYTILSNKKDSTNNVSHWK